MSTNYRAGVFTSLPNLAFIAVGTAVGLLAVGLPALLGVVAAEAAVLWIAPDFKSVQQSLDQTSKNDSLEKNRWWYLKTLWGVVPSNNPGLAIFKRPTVWSHVFDEYRLNSDMQTFVSMCQTIDGLWDLRTVKPDAISEDQLDKMELMINGWLNLMETSKNIRDSLSKLDPDVLRDEMDRLENLKKGATTDADRIVVEERFKTLRDKIRSIPRLQNKLGLTMANADTIVQHMDDINNQARTSGAADVGSILDTVAMDKMMCPSDGADEMVIAAQVRNMVSSTESDSESTWEELRNTLGEGSTPRTGVKVKIRTLR